MKFTFLSPSNEGNLEDNLNATLERVKVAMSKGAKVNATPRTDPNGNPCLWVDLIQKHKSENVKLLLSDGILNCTLNYLGTGKVDDFNLNLSKVEEMKEEYKEKNFAFELFKYEVEMGRMINVTINTETRFRCFTSFPKGKLVYSLNKTEEIAEFLSKYDLD